MLIINSAYKLCGGQDVVCVFKGYSLEEEEKTRSVHKLAKSLKNLRCMCGWSQEVLASYIGVTRQTIISIEKGKREMTWTMFLALTLLFLANNNTKDEFISLGICTDGLAKFLSISKN